MDKKEDYNMRKYVGTEMTEATPMNRGDYNTYRGWTIPANENPNDEGYIVKRNDGHVNWLPKKLFEDTYHDCLGMPFGIALDLLKHGCKVAREGWNGKKQYIELATGISYVNNDDEIVNCEHKNIGNKAIAFVGTSGVQMGWLATQSDMLAEDWVIVE